MGLLDALSDPVAMAQIEERYQLVGRLAQQMGVTREEARQALFYFEVTTSSDGQTVH